MGDTTALVPAQQGVLASTGLDVLTLGRVLAKSGYFKDAADEAKAVVKILKGSEIGIGPIASMTGIHIIQGKPTVSAGTMAAVIRASRSYDYRVIHRTDERCEIAFMRRSPDAPSRWQEEGRATWTMADARKAKLVVQDGTWEKYPRAMLFARAMSEGATAYCPDLWGGATLYTPEEMGAEVDPATGEVLTPAPEPGAHSGAHEVGSGGPEPAAPEQAEEDERYWQRRAMGRYTEYYGKAPKGEDASAEWHAECRQRFGLALKKSVVTRTDLDPADWETLGQVNWEILALEKDEEDLERAQAERRAARIQRQAEEMRQRSNAAGALQGGDEAEAALDMLPESVPAQLQGR